VSHYANPQFWKCYNNLPADIRALADESFERLKSNPQHPSIHLKKVGHNWPVRVGRKYRCLGGESSKGIVWFWIGSHAQYNTLLKS